ncbi:glycerophosphodiester phosphodiesterase [soil metagenome]
MQHIAIVGHRGAAGEAPENTMAGFRWAQRHGVNILETDVRLTADGVPVLMHDATVDRTTDGSGEVGEMTIAELQKLRADRLFPGWQGDVRIPTLNTLLAMDDPFEELLIEIKDDHPDRLRRLIPLVLEMIVQSGVADRVRVSSFEHDILRQVRRIAPDQRRWLIHSGSFGDMVALARDLGCDAVGMPMQLLTCERVRAMQTTGLMVGRRNAIGPEGARMLAACGVDAITTDFPSQIGEWLAG